MNNMIPLQYASVASAIAQPNHISIVATVQPNHRSITLSMMILGPIHASNLCHTIHHEEKDISKMK
jgi:hypothetical protein